MYLPYSYNLGKNDYNFRISNKNINFTFSKVEKTTHYSQPLYYTYMYSYFTYVRNGIHVQNGGSYITIQIVCFSRQSAYNITDGSTYWFISRLGLIGSLQMTVRNKSTANTKETDGGVLLRARYKCTRITPSAHTGNDRGEGNYESSELWRVYRI